MITLENMDHGVPITPSPIVSTLYWGTRVMQALPPETEIRVEGFERPDEPVVFAMNHTHMYDFLPLRWSAFHQGDVFMASWIKLRAYQDPWMRAFLENSGNVPLGSRGYIISGDFKQVLGRTPTDREYRRLRDHVDDGEPLPDAEPYTTIRNRPRRMMGWSFEPSRATYRETVLATYEQMMATSLQIGRRGLERGVHMHMYPQGQISSRLSRGRIGVIQVALAYDLPIVPVGCSGCREVYTNGSTPWMGGGGEIVVRFGDPWRVPSEQVSEDFRPFDPDDEARHREQLQTWADEVVERINPLLEPRYQWLDGESDGKEGVRRFIK